MLSSSALESAILIPLLEKCPSLEKLGLEGIRNSGIFSQIADILKAGNCPLLGSLQVGAVLQYTSRNNEFAELIQSINFNTSTPNDGSAREDGKYLERGMTEKRGLQSVIVSSALKFERLWVQALISHHANTLVTVEVLYMSQGAIHLMSNLPHLRSFKGVYWLKARSDGEDHDPESLFKMDPRALDAIGGDKVLQKKISTYRNLPPNPSIHRYNSIAITAMSSATSPSSRATDYFETGPNHVLVEVSGLDQDSFPAEFQSTWDLDHVRLPCAKRTYPTEPNYWPQIVQGLSEPILNSQQLSELMLGWNPGKRNGWNMNALDAFLNNRSMEEDERAQQGNSSDVALDPADQAAQEKLLESDYGSNYSDVEYDDGTTQPGEDQSTDSVQQETGIKAYGTGEPLKSQFLSYQERQYFFDVVLPRMQALALRLPELVKKPIPFLKQQQDSAVTLSQEQIACLLSNAFFNTFPCRNSPYKRGRKKRFGPKGGQNSSQNQQPQVEEDEEEEESEEEEDKKHHAKGNKASKESRGGRGGGQSQRGGRGGHNQQENRGKNYLKAPRPPRKRRTQGPAAQFEFFEGTVDKDLSASVENLTVKDHEEVVDPVETSSSAAVEPREVVPKMPSINFISLFWSEENRTPCTPTQAAKLRCIFHYFDRVTTEMPQGTVTYHRQVLKKPVFFTPGEMLRGEGFKFSKVTIDSVKLIEQAPNGALRLDFANKNLGGGALDKGAVQEEIQFMVCPELILSRLITQQLEANEAVLIKGAECYSNHTGYSKTFEWRSDHRDSTPRDKLGRRNVEICAIDARPFKSRISRLEQFERHYVLREVNKALAGFRISPINASEWGLARQDGNNDQSSLAIKRFRPIATGNWGCGAFGGHLQLKFILQWIAASVCAGFSLQEAGDSIGDEVLYYTFGMHQLKDEIEMFVEAVEALKNPVDPKRVLDSIIHYPRRNPAGAIQGFREKTLLEYLKTAIAFVPQA
ncbi:hypothetical protein BGZ76_006053 [Entomortierella beljakovae]|nr:hypothetical protein BGZ76_006053 [Entomortierella beljakovae]